VGALARLRPGVGPAELTAAAALVDPFAGPMGLHSPWSPHSDHLEQIVIADIIGGAVPRPLTRSEAMRIPAVARARHIIAGTIARIELGAYRGDERIDRAEQPGWIAATDGPLSPFHRMLWTIDDLFFYGWSLWTVTARAADSSGGFPLRMDRVPMGRWDLERDTGRVLTYQPVPGHPLAPYTLQPAPPRSVVLIPGGTEGLLADGQPTLKHANDLQRSAHNAGRHPTAYLGLKQTSGQPLKRRSDDTSEVTVETILADWRQARNNPEGGGVAWLGGVEPVELGTFAEHILESGRNAAAVDIARHASIPADLIDASVTESSLHYSTSRDNDRRFIDYGLGLYTSATTARLTQNDVTPNGQRVAFDIEQWLKGAAPMPGQTPTEAAPGMTPDGQETPQ
jgi:hypothetical protein